MGTTHSENSNNRQMNWYRVISLVDRPDLQQLLDIYTDYIVKSKTQPLTKQLTDTGSCRLIIYSTLKQTERDLVLEVRGNEIGLELSEEAELSSGILKITKLFKGSPLEKHGVAEGEFIVGMLNCNFQNLTEFSEIIKLIIAEVKKQSQVASVLRIAIRNIQHSTNREIRLSYQQLLEWQAISRRRGVLGCQLAEGYKHKWQLINKINARNNNTRQSDIIDNRQFCQQTVSKAEQTQHSNKLQEIQQSNPNQLQQSGLEITENCVNQGQKQENDEMRPLKISSEPEQQKLQIQQQLNASRQIPVEQHHITKLKQIQHSIVPKTECYFCKCEPIDQQCQKCYQKVTEQGEQLYLFFNKKNKCFIKVPHKHFLH